MTQREVMERLGWSVRQIDLYTGTIQPRDLDENLWLYSMCEDRRPVIEQRLIRWVDRFPTCLSIFKGAPTDSPLRQFALERMMPLAETYGEAKLVFDRTANTEASDVRLAALRKMYSLANTQRELRVLYRYVRSNPKWAELAQAVAEKLGIANSNRPQPEETTFAYWELRWFNEMENPAEQNRALQRLMELARTLDEWVRVWRKTQFGSVEREVVIGKIRNFQTDFRAWQHVWQDAPGKSLLKSVAFEQMIATVDNVAGANLILQHMPKHTEIPTTVLEQLLGHVAAFGQLLNLLNRIRDIDLREQFIQRLADLANTVAEWTEVARKSNGYPNIQAVVVGRLDQLLTTHTEWITFWKSMPRESPLRSHALLRISQLDATFEEWESVWRMAPKGSEISLLALDALFQFTD